MGEQESPAMPSDIVVRPLRALSDFQRCVQIAREVWGDSELDTEPYITFVIADHTGGQVLGAYDGDLLVGFTKAYIGIHGTQPYLHSHMTGVLPSHRDRRVGRHLKLAQREDALRRNIRLVEWTFDPLETKNAHFNINRLGAISRKYIQSFYGITTSPLHRNMATDRLLVEWQLDTKRVVSAINELTRDPRECPAHIHLPAELEEWKTTAPDRVVELQTRIRQQFADWFSKGYAVLGVRFSTSGVDYCLAPYSEF